MSATPLRPRNPSEGHPRHHFDAATLHACDVYTGLVARLASPKILGDEGRARASQIRSYSSAPRPSDWERLAAAGQRDGVVAYYESEIERMKGVPLPDLDVSLAVLSREQGEFVAVAIEATSNPSLRRRVIDEGFDVVRAAAVLVRGHMRLHREEREVRAAVRDRLGLRAD